ncbi:putative odorant receptor 71a [Lutzomyia longipalpis]|uniref:putative odorant receptor 71a n=1 Tax=Lutzomyia longipalpis TaxID=7200 RepID=UPI002483A836|nr:putative odorant receptor 71a [Lutzomyia longipalpis]
MLSIAAVTNVFCKLVTVSYFEEDIEKLFYWIENFYIDYSATILAEFKSKYLARTLPYLKLYIKMCIIFVCGFFIYAIISYTINDILVMKVPYLSKEVNVFIQQAIYFGYIFFYGIPILCFTSTGLIFIGILRLFNEFIEKFETTDVPESESMLLLYKLHLDIYEKFIIYEKIFAYCLFFDMTLHGGAMIIVLLIIHLFPGLYVFYYSFSVMCFQVFIYCGFGQFILSETERIQISLYLTKWYEKPPTTQKTLLLMMTMASRPFGLKAGGMYHINLMFFIDILKVCFTYYAIIYALL